MVAGGGARGGTDEANVSVGNAGLAAPVEASAYRQPRLGTLDDPLVLGFRAMAWAEAVRASPSPTRDARAWEPLDGVPILRNVGTGEDYSTVRAVVCAPEWSWPCAEAIRVVQGPTSLCPNGESGGNWAAYNAGNYGGFQINAVHAWRVGGNLMLLFDAETNVRVAHEIYVDNGGWGPWACRP